MKRQKYGNVKTVVDGHTFDSAKEAKRYGELKLLQRYNHITNLVLQPAYRVEINGKHICTYKADFSYIEAGRTIAEDVKSKITKKNPVYRIKKKLVEALHGVQILET